MKESIEIKRSGTYKLTVYAVVTEEVLSWPMEERVRFLRQSFVDGVANAMNNAGAEICPVEDFSHKYMTLHWPGREENAAD